MSEHHVFVCDNCGKEGRVHVVDWLRLEPYGIERARFGHNPWPVGLDHMPADHALFCSWECAATWTEGVAGGQR